MEDGSGVAVLELILYHILESLILTHKLRDLIHSANILSFMLKNLKMCLLITYLIGIKINLEYHILNTEVQ
jgi:hypothetical protein